MTHPAPITHDDISAARWIVTHADDYSDAPEARLDAWRDLKSGQGRPMSPLSEGRLQLLQAELQAGAELSARMRADREARMQQVAASRAAREQATPATTIPAALLSAERPQIRRVVEDLTGILTGVGLTFAVAWVCLVGIPAAVQLLL
jgi:hypothetical protein